MIRGDYGYPIDTYPPRLFLLFFHHSLVARSVYTRIISRCLSHILNALPLSFSAAMTGFDALSGGSIRSRESAVSILRVRAFDRFLFPIAVVEDEQNKQDSRRDWRCKGWPLIFFCRCINTIAAYRAIQNSFLYGTQIWTYNFPFLTQYTNFFWIVREKKEHQVVQRVNQYRNCITISSADLNFITILTVKKYAKIYNEKKSRNIFQSKPTKNKSLSEGWTQR